MIKVAEPYIEQDEIDAAVQVLLSGNYISGKEVAAFEEEFARYVGTKYAIACNSGTAALHMVLKSLGIGPGDRIIVPDMSFFATASAVLMTGAVVDFADVDSNCNISAGSIRDLIKPNTKAIIPVHLYGMPCDMIDIMKVAEEYNLFVIEDCAQAHGAEYRGKKVGSFGIANCFSFFATKNMTTIEGGIITTDEKYVHKACNLLRSHGMIDRNTHTVLGYNYRMTEVNAAIGRIQLGKLGMLNAKRINNSNYLTKGLHSKYIKPFLKFDPGIKKPVYFWFPVEVSFAIDKVMEILRENGIGFRHRYYKPLHTQPLFRGAYDHVKNSISEYYSARVLGLPNHPGLTKNDLDVVLDVINRYDPFGE